MKTTLVLALVCLMPVLPSCTSALTASRQKARSPFNELNATPKVYQAKQIANASYDVYRIEGWLIDRDKPRACDLYIPKQRKGGKAKIIEVGAKTAQLAATGATQSVAVDLRYTSQMLLQDEKYKKNTPLAIGVSIYNKATSVTVGLLEGEQFHEWDVPLHLKRVQRGRSSISTSKGLYALTIPADIIGAALIGGLALYGDSADDSFDE